MLINNRQIDTELKELLSKTLPKILVIGIGGAGNNTISRLYITNNSGIRTIAVNTDAQDLLKVRADKKILIGKELTKGLGTGSFSEIGEKAAQENIEEIKQIFADASVVFLTCGLGGGTGTGSIPIIAELAKKAGLLTIAIVTVPFTMEGKKRYENAVQGLLKLEKVTDSLIIISNDRLLELYPNLPINTTFMLCDKLLAHSINAIIEMITKPGLVNLDLADLRAVMKDMGYAIIALGESDSKEKAREAIESALKTPLFDVVLRDSGGALVNVSGGEDLTLEEAHKVVDFVINEIGYNTKLIWGAQIELMLKNKIKVMAVITGIPRERFEKYFSFDSYRANFHLVKDKGKLARC